MPLGQRLMLGIAAVIWLAAGLGGGTVLYRYAYAPGQEARVQPGWPADSRLARNTGGNTLVVAIHPQCPCTRASMVELNDLMLSLRGKVKAYVLVIKPQGSADGWEETEAVKRARSIPGVTVVSDGDGKEAARFGAETSGQAFLYDARGKLAFNGGLTASRGHIGDNAGVESIASLIDSGKAGQSTSLVFGCPLNAKVCLAKKTDVVTQEPKGAENGE